MTPDVLQWIGCAFGVTGSLMLASRTKCSGWGFILFLISNIFWIAYGIEIDAHGLLVMQIFFSVTSLIGVYRWFGLGFKTLPRISLSRAKARKEGVNHVR